MKYSNEYKRMCIEMYYRGKYPETPEWLSSDSFHHIIRRWVRVSEKAGLDSVDHKAHSQKWTAEKKLEIVEKVLSGRVYPFEALSTCRLCLPTIFFLY